MHSENDAVWNDAVWSQIKNANASKSIRIHSGEFKISGEIKGNYFSRSCSILWKLQKNKIIIFVSSFAVASLNLMHVSLNIWNRFCLINNLFKFNLFCFILTNKLNWVFNQIFKFFVKKKLSRKNFQKNFENFDFTVSFNLFHFFLSVNNLKKHRRKFLGSKNTQKIVEFFSAIDFDQWDSGNAIFRLGTFS